MLQHNPLLPLEQAGFRHRRSVLDQVILLTQDIENSFSAKKKAGAVIVDLTEVYNTVSHHGLTCKLLPDKTHGPHDHGDGWQLQLYPTTGNGQRSRLRRRKNGVPQGSILVPLLFNIYISDLPTTISRKYAYADNLAIMHADGDWQAVEGTLSKDMANVGEYLQTWKLKLSITKMVSAGFHLNNKEAMRELKVNFNNETLPYCFEPKYLGFTLDRSLTYHRHLDPLRQKLTSRVTLLRWLAGVLEQQHWEQLP